METRKINISELSENTGQIAGLPANPRQWTKEEAERLAISIKETPELLEARGCIVFPFEGKYVVLGGNMRQEQVDVNNRVLEGRDLPVAYICDDGRNVAKHFAPESQDLLFSCPPYFDLEKYSDLDNDASNQKSYADFIAILDTAFKSALTCLKNNRFAVVVVGDVRNKRTGYYYDFCGDIKRIMREGG